MKTVLIGAVLNVVLDPVFIFVFGMGVRGAAIATVISQAVSAAWVVVFLSGSKSTLRLRKAFLRLDSKLLLPAVCIGRFALCHAGDRESAYGNIQCLTAAVRAVTLRSER